MVDAVHLDDAPVSELVTAYDERHLVTYLRLLDADAEQADWREAVRVIFDIDPSTCEDRARRMHTSHLERARWMSRTGYRQLAERGHDTPKMD